MSVQVYEARPSGPLTVEGCTVQVILGGFGFDVGALLGVGAWLPGALGLDGVAMAVPAIGAAMISAASVVDSVRRKALRGGGVVIVGPIRRTGLWAKGSNM